MYFDLTDDQKAIRQAVGSLLQDKLDAQRTRQLFDAGSLNQELWTSLMELGLGSILVPDTQGGLGLDMLTLSVVAECLGYYGAPAPVAQCALAAWLMAKGCSESQRERWLGKLMNGKAIASFAFFESNAGWLTTDWTLGTARLNGQKHYVEWADVADLLIIGVSGGGLALVETASPGVTITPTETLDRSRPLFSVSLKDVEHSLLIGEPLAEPCVDALLIILAADACGAGNHAYEMAVAYAKERQQFGQIIGTFQALKHQLANMAVDMEPCRALFWYAAHAWDTLPQKRAHAAANAKAHIGEMAVKTARSAVECHGGVGYTWEYTLHVYLKRAMHSRISMGLPSVHRERMACLAGW